MVIVRAENEGMYELVENRILEHHSKYQYSIENVRSVSILRLVIQ